MPPLFLPMRRGRRLWYVNVSAAWLLEPRPRGRTRVRWGPGRRGALTFREHAFNVKTLAAVRLEEDGRPIPARP